MTPQEFLFWIIVGIMFGTLIILVANQMLFNMIPVTVTVRTP
jgi:hypothetical protein